MGSYVPAQCAILGPNYQQTELATGIYCLRNGAVPLPLEPGLHAPMHAHFHPTLTGLVRCQLACSESQVLDEAMDRLCQR